MLRGMDPHGPPTLLLDPIAARQFIDRAGFTKKDALIDWLYETATMPAGEYWDTQLIQNYIYPRATYGEEPFASNLKPEDELIPVFQEKDINVVVVGGEAGGFTAEKISRFESERVPVGAYGVGSSLIRGSNDFTGDIVITDGEPSAKFGRHYRENPRLELVT